jgi:hypothetical protein
MKNKKLFNVLRLCLLYLVSVSVPVVIVELGWMCFFHEKPSCHSILSTAAGCTVAFFILYFFRKKSTKKNDV